MAFRSFLQGVLAVNITQPSDLTVVGTVTDNEFDMVGSLAVFGDILIVSKQTALLWSTSVTLPS